MHGKQTEIEIPCWSLNQGLDVILEENELASRHAYDILALCTAEKNTIEESLQLAEIYVRPGHPQILFIKKQDNILIQLIEQKYTDETQQNLIEEQRARNVRIGEELSQHSAKLNAIFDSTALFIWTQNADMTITSLNKRFKERMAAWFFRDVESGEFLFEDPREENKSAWKTYQEMVVLGLKGKKQHFELSLLTDLENLVWIELFIDPIIHPQNGEIHEVSCMAFEVTEKKEVAKSIKQSLKEKETLLQEVHHRVKNNLQIISSIMNLQSSYVKEEDTMNILMECQNRIKSMSFIHDSLYLNKDLGSVDFQFYIHGLCRNLVQSYSVDPSKIDLQLEIDNVDLSLDQAIPCGLIVNELVSNAMKYAFPEGKSGILKISVQEKAGRMMMEIKDNGVGVGDGIRLEDIESLGLQLVFTLIEQLDGEVEYSSHQGTKYLITFDRLKSRKLWQEPTYS